MILPHNSCNMHSKRLLAALALLSCIRFKPPPAHTRPWTATERSRVWSPDELCLGHLLSFRSCHRLLPMVADSAIAGGYRRRCSQILRCRGSTSRVKRSPQRRACCWSGSTAMWPSCGATAPPTGAWVSKALTGTSAISSCRLASTSVTTLVRAPFETGGGEGTWQMHCFLLHQNL